MKMATTKKARQLVFEDGGSMLNSLYKRGIISERHQLKISMATFKAF